MGNSLKTTLAALATLAAAGLSSTAFAGTGITAKASTLGLGPEVTFGITDRLALRAGMYQYDDDYDTTESNIEYKLNANLDARAIYLDFHPFKGSFRLTMGLMENLTDFQGVAAGTQPIDINGTLYDPADLGSLTATIDWSGGDERVPYFGIGWSTAPRDSGFGFALDLGIVKMGEPNGSLTTVGGNPLVVDDPTFQANLAAEEQEFQNSIKDFDTYPFVALGISFHF